MPGPRVSPKSKVQSPKSDESDPGLSTLDPGLILSRLRPRYGRMPWRPHGDPITELVLTILSQHTNDTNSGKAFATMQARFPTWYDVLRAEPAALIETIRVGGLANQKAPRIQ